MLHNYKVPFVFIWDSKVIEEGVGRFTHHHGAEELTTEPGTASRGDAGFDDCDLQIRSFLAQYVRGGQAA
jgi:hypothetical protein